MPETQPISLHPETSAPVPVPAPRRRRRWDAETKRQLTIKAHTMRAEGRRWSEIAEELDVLEGSLRRWLEDFTRAAPHAEVSEAGEAPELFEHASGSLSVKTPDGFVVTGLDLESAHMLIEMLRAE